jgi:hypothetical protein
MDAKQQAIDSEKLREKLGSAAYEAKLKGEAAAAAVSKAKAAVEQAEEDIR